MYLISKMNSENVNGYLIVIKNNVGQNDEIGYIEYYHYVENKTVNINTIFVHESYRKKSYGTFLMFLMFFHIGVQLNTKIISFTLNDSSSLNLTKDSIYYKLGFRIYDNAMDNMVLLLNKTNIIDYITSNNFLQNKIDTIFIKNFQDVIIDYETIVKEKRHHLETITFKNIIDNINSNGGENKRTLMKLTIKELQKIAQEKNIKYTIGVGIKSRNIKQKSLVNKIYKMSSK